MRFPQHFRLKLRPLARAEGFEKLSGSGRGGRVVECSGLENRRTGNRSVSSNLTHAAETKDPGHQGHRSLVVHATFAPASIRSSRSNDR
jgi:hypothetical protein